MKNQNQRNKAVIVFGDLSKHGGCKGSCTATIYDRQAFGEPMGDVGYQLSYERCKEVAEKAARDLGYKHIEFYKNWQR